ncbi:RNA polymerase sigma factor SigZ [Desulfovibrio inopinatus]|uniref:RNA polymerase sigma factor SigZ n=1 Tax=Desulfovibrio inopinatus TaxID=102109 RepID=UPI0004241446|nr:RNA polymerase sigma factor SigZ [Desulfovibrio inopinatus]
MNTTEEVWKKYHANLLAFIRKRVNDKVAAEDILQDIFVRVHSRIGTLENRSRLESWLYQITRNAIIDFYRSHKPLEELPVWLEQPQVGKEETNRQELSLCLAPMIQQLPKKYRHAVQLSEIEGRTQKEVAEIENISLSGAKSRVQRGRALLKDMFHDCCKVEINTKNQIVDYIKENGDCKFC